MFVCSVSLYVCVFDSPYVCVFVSPYVCAFVSLFVCLPIYCRNSINSAGKRDRLGLLVSSDKLLVTNRPKAAAEGSGLRPVSYPRNGRGPLPKAAARAPLGFAVFQKVEVRVAQFHS